jgi:hypothetical protein
VFEPEHAPVAPSHNTDVAQRRSKMQASRMRHNRQLRYLTAKHASRIHIATTQHNTTQDNQSATFSFGALQVLCVCVCAVCVRLCMCVCVCVCSAALRLASCYAHVCVGVISHVTRGPVGSSHHPRACYLAAQARWFTRLLRMYSCNTVSFARESDARSTVLLALLLSSMSCRQARVASCAEHTRKRRLLDAL